MYLQTVHHAALVLGWSALVITGTASGVPTSTRMGDEHAEQSARVDPWPCRIVAAATLRRLFEQAWERSATMRAQCDELARARAVVRLDWGSADSLSHATTALTSHGGVVVATVKIPPVGDTIQLLAHELRHVVEHTRGLNFDAESKRPESGVWRAFSGFETQAAIDVSRQVGLELREHRQTIK